MKGYQKAIGCIIILYVVGFISFGFGRRYGRIEGMESRVSAASCQQFVIDAQQRYQERMDLVMGDASGATTFDAPVRGKR